MSYLLEQLVRDITTTTTTDAWWGVLVFFLLCAGLSLLGYGLGFTINFNGPFPWLTWNSNDTRTWRERIVFSLIGIVLLGPGLIGLIGLTSITTLEVLTSLSKEEYTQFQELEDKFHEEYKGKKLRIRSENVNWSDLRRRLKQERIDVIIFDVTRRLDLLREELLKPMDDHRRFIPSSIYPILLDNVNFDKRLYFIPYRPNVRIGWWNSHHPIARAYKCEQTRLPTTVPIGWRNSHHPTARADASTFEPPWLPKTWQEVKTFAEFRPKPDCIDDPSEQISDQFGVILSANGAEWVDDDESDLRGPPLDAALLLLEVLMASGKKPWQVCESWQMDDKDAPLNVLRDIYHKASKRSRDTDWQTATGHLLSRHVALARNWSFSISAMRNSGELQNFHPYVAWKWAGANNTPLRMRTLLGGDAIALPRYGRQGDAVDKLLRFLISKDAQRIFMEDLTWPPMRFDVKTKKAEEGNKPKDEKDKDQKEGNKPKDEKDKDQKEGNKPRAMDPCLNAEIPIKDATCHGDSPPTGKNATKCECLHRELARVAVRDALRYAEAPPRFWSPEMHKSFTAAFHVLVSTEEKKEHTIGPKLKEAAGLYCLAPESEKKLIPPPKVQFVMTWRGEQGKRKLDDYIKLRFEGFPNTTLKGVLPKWLLNTLPKWLLNVTWNDVLDKPRIRVKLVESKDLPKAEDPPKATSYHTDLCVQLDSNNQNLDSWIKIPAGFTSVLSEPVSVFLSRAVEIKGGKAWELEDPDAKCNQKSIASSSEGKIVLEYKDQPVTVVVLPFTLLASLVFGAYIGRFFESGLQQKLLEQLWKAAREQFTITRVLQVSLFILVVLPLWFTLERLEYAKEVRQFFSDVPVQAWFIPVALLLGFFLEMRVELFRNKR